MAIARAWESVTAVVNLTLAPAQIADRPIAEATCVLPVPDAPRHTTFSRCLVNSPDPRPSTSLLRSKGTSEKSKVSKDLSVGNLAPLMGDASRCSARDSISAARHAARDSRCPRPALAASRTTSSKAPASPAS